ncbi:hypothetical protein [uncultured Sphaerochaeta sp.]|uniref:hypothetical protein n=1 Tax=uncultured Sphaerochaeta sp. TaxID=886478 RepID=UPI002A0A5FF9|nr:hypothetical protein [uncultured Sphaerochaeta sp.]
MEIYQMEGNNEAPKQIWLDGGIQLIASQGVEIPGSCLLNHICLRVPDVETALMKANKYHISTLAKGQNWIVLDYGLCIEILPME